MVTLGAVAAAGLRDISAIAGVLCFVFALVGGLALGWVMDWATPSSPEGSEVERL
jgi:hypothetical protein